MRAILRISGLLFFFLATCGAEGGIDWAKTAVPPLRKSDYLWLRDCVSAKSIADVAGAVSCFRDVRNLSIDAEPGTAPSFPSLKFSGLRALGNPPIVVVPDCLEFVLQILRTDDAAFFRSAVSEAINPPPNASFYYQSTSTNPSSVFGIEANHPQRRIPCGEYTSLFNALIRAGYVDGVTLLAGLWSTDDPTGSIKSTIGKVSKPIIVARGTGCAIAASAAASIDKGETESKVRALFCLSDPPDAAVSPGTFASDLGLLQRRRGRLLPVVAGPWGDGNGARRCALPSSISVNLPAALSSSLCSADCIRGGWLKDANLADCFRSRTMSDEIECLSGALVKMEEKLVRPESPLGD